MSSVVISGDTSGAITLSAPAVSGTNTATLPAATGTVMVSGNMPAFSAYLDTVDALTNSAYTKVLYNTEVFDTNNNFASGRFTPTVAGYYQLSGSVSFDGQVTSETVFVLYKNGNPFNIFIDIISPLYAVSGSCLVYANGTTDYFEMYIYQNSSRNAYGASGAQRYTWFNGSMVRGA